MDDTSTVHQKHELRQRLESMKKAYARTLRKVQKSEKAKRARSHVQRKIAEQAQGGANDASPSCTHRQARSTPSQQDSHHTSHPHSPIGESVRYGTDEAPRGSDKAEEGVHVASKSAVATRRLQRKRRSVSFIIPKELSFTESPSDEVKGKTAESFPGTSEVETCNESLKASQEQLPPSCVCEESADTTAVPSSPCSCGRTRDILGTRGDNICEEKCKRSCLDEKVILVVPESQPTLSESDFAHVAVAASNHPASGSSQEEKYTVNSVKENRNNLVSHDNSKDCVNVPSGECLYPSNIASLPKVTAAQCTASDKTDQADNVMGQIGKPSSKSHTRTSAPVQTRRAGRSSRRHFRKTRELTVSDISLKEVVESQNTEEGSHTWLEGLMFPVEYYVRQTRSMTSSQCSQRQSKQATVDAQRHKDTNAAGKERIGSLTITPCTSKNPPALEFATSTSGAKNLPDAAGSIIESGSDSLSSQLSESLLKATNAAETQRTGSLTVAPCTSNNSPGQGLATWTSGAENLTDVADNVADSGSDTQSSQLSESLLKPTAVQPQLQVYTDKGFKDTDRVKLSRNTKNRRLLQRRGARCGKRNPLPFASTIDINEKLGTVAVAVEKHGCSGTLNKEDGISTSDIKSPSSIEVIPKEDSQVHHSMPDVQMRSCPDALTGKLPMSLQKDVQSESSCESMIGEISHALTNLKLPETEFVLPAADFGEMKLVKLQSSHAAAIPTSKDLPCNLKDQKECRSDFDEEEYQPSLLSLRIEGNGIIHKHSTKKTEQDEACIHQRHSSAGKSSPVPPATSTVKTTTSPLRFIASPHRNGSNDSDKRVVGNDPAKGRPCVEVSKNRSSRACLLRDFQLEDGALLELATTKNCQDKEVDVARGPLEKSQGKSILHSQLSPTQFHEDGSMVFPHCTPGWSQNSCSNLDSRISLAKDVLLSSQNATLELANQRHKDECREEELVCKEDRDITGEKAAILALDSKPNSLQSVNVMPGENQGSSCLLPSGPRSLPITRPSHPQSNLPEDSMQSTLSALQTSHGVASKAKSSSVGSHAQERVMCNNSTADESALATTKDGNVTPPNVLAEIAGVVFGDPKGNIKHKSPFAGVATGTPPERAEEPKAMSQCEVKSSREDEEEAKEKVDGTERSSRYKLALMGCLQHDLPWEASPMVQDVAGGEMTMNGESASVLLVLYQHTMVIWWRHTDMMEWQILQSWIIPKDEEFICARLMPCSRDNMISLVVTGVFASCGVRVLNYNTETKEVKELDVDLVGSCEMPVPYLLCAVGQHNFITAVKDDRNKHALFLVHACFKSSDVQTVRLSTGMETELTSLLPIEGAKEILMATTSHNNILLWNCRTGELIKDLPMKPVDGSGVISCVKATAESGLLFLVVVFRDSSDIQEARCPRPVGATVVLNPNTDKMATLMQYQPSCEHANASLVDAVVLRNSLLVKLSDGSIHQWDIFSGNLMNYSSSHPTNHRLRSAHLCHSQVVLFENGLCQQLYDLTEVTS